MNNRANKIIYSILALVVYVGIMVGFGFILNLFWKIEGVPNTMYWITTAVVCVLVAFYIILMLVNAKDKGVGAIQLFFTICLSFMPLLVRIINMIPVAGIYISAVLLFIVGSIYLITMLSMGYYATDINSDNKQNRI